ncbi:hypothetical protein Aph01nite_40090 [Acrocarpospora phusangensis]|uniref:Uncharacterized protein n=1 Tax=Acrocarpospora phusangensis TaxID=1070424 RepID=A0A919UL67_9ACTN|nr:hypothetical protein [Acrocarpospora phusangensis]GIH25699.1 hypothetical protein Aph01nite_40090 [Acrocarpospora phusangensis]
MAREIVGDGGSRPGTHRGRHREMTGGTRGAEMSVAMDTVRDMEFTVGDTEGSGDGR